MFLAIDIGNSTTKFGLFDGERLVKKITIPTVRQDTEEAIYKQISKEISDSVSAIVVSTVVKELKEAYKNLGNNYFNIEPFFADYNFDFGFKINYFPPKNCGSDRLVVAYSALENQKLDTPFIVCDFGTATTIDLVNKNRQYMGGIIAPGPKTLASALFEKTSELPNIELALPENVIGNSTVSSIQSGIYFGYVGLVDGIIERMISEIGETSLSIISTGGFAELISKKSNYIQKEFIDENLMLKGLRLIGEKFNGN